MQAITAREKRLILIFAGSVFLVLNLTAFHFLSKERRSAALRLQQLRLEQQEASAWLQQKDFWMQRKTWLDEKQPKAGAQGQETSALLESLQQSARQQNIAITQQKLLDPRKVPAFREVSVQLEVRGSYASVVRWLASLQEPEKFIAVKSLTLKSDAEPPNVVATLNVARWYAPNP